ncbi:MAG: cation-translocating P-type ATPase, partial [Steroidobacter sp.]
AELISFAGLQDYYQYRDEPAIKPDSHQDEWSVYAQATVANQYVRIESNNHCSTIVLVDGIRCAACSWLIDRMLRRDAAITEVNVNVATSRVQVKWQGEVTYFEKVLRTLASLGYKPHAMDAAGMQQHASDERRSMLKRLGIAGVGMMQVMMYVLPMYVHSDMDSTVRHYLQLTGLILTTPVMFYSGWPFVTSAWRAIKLRSINMDVPVALALLLAYAASTWNTLTQHGETYFDSVCMFIFLLTLARFVVMTVRHRSQSVTDALVRIQPRIAHRVNQEAIDDVAVHLLSVDDVVMVRVGEAFPADGEITSGQSTVDESLLTGESLPITRGIGEKVLAGSINVSAPLHVRVTQLGQKTVLSVVIALLEQVHGSKSSSALMADRISRWFLHGMLLITAIVAVSWWLIDPSRVFSTVLAVLVITCPCALSLAAPAVVAAATSALAKRGLLITNADAIERLSQITKLSFDKTGTLTTGKISVTQTRLCSDMSADECIGIASALEKAADHPIARAFAVRDTVSISDIKVIAGSGVEGVIEGTRYRIGNAQFVNELVNPAASIVDDQLIWLGSSRQILATFQLSDPPRNESRAVIDSLRQLGVDSAILSGDSAGAVEQVAHYCGIADYHSRLTPADKVQVLKQYQSHTPVAMIGDGINDAPVLGAASVSIAMGGGTSLAQASADAVLMNNSLSVLPQAIRLARKAQQIMKQNLYWAAIYNFSAIPMAALGYITPWAAAAGMSLSSVLVVLNATRVLRDKAS